MIVVKRREHVRSVIERRELGMKRKKRSAVSSETMASVMTISAVKGMHQLESHASVLFCVVQYF